MNGSAARRCSAQIRWGRELLRWAGGGGPSGRDATPPGAPKTLVCDWVAPSQQSFLNFWLIFVADDCEPYGTQKVPAPTVLRSFRLRNCADFRSFFVFASLSWAELSARILLKH